MSNPQVTLRLEYVVRSKDHADLVEPLLFVREFQPVVFRWDTLSNLHGAAVLAVQVKDLLNNVPTYGLYRVRSETDPELEDGLAPTQVTMQCSAVKVVWDDEQFTMAYIFQQEQGRTSSDTLANTLNNATKPWRFVLLKQEGAAGPAYSLIMIEEAAQGGVEKCQALANDDIDCANPPSRYWQRQCDIKDCS